MFETLISVDELLGLMRDPQLKPVIVDCRFSLGDRQAGAQAYAAAHIPSAVFADLELDLSGPVIPGKTGRHPLPDPGLLAEKFGRWGISSDTQVIAYDDAGGSFAARLWWLHGWLGHSKRAVLDGGWAAWQKAGGELSQDVPAALARTFVPKLHQNWVCSTWEVEAGIADGALALFDARAVERYAGEIEPIDAVAGHLPSAQSLPFMGNLIQGHFLPREQLRARLDTALGGAAAESVMYCGSGVTACHNILAAAHAGLPIPRLYAGSYSEWITDPEHAVETGRPRSK